MANQTITEWAGSASHKDLQLVHAFLSKQTIASMDSTDLVLAINRLFQALGEQLALEQEVYDEDINMFLDLGWSVEELRRE